MATDSESESSKVERIVSKFFSKCTHVILESRYTNVVQNKVTSDVATSNDKWFNLLLVRDIPTELIQTTDVSSSVKLMVDLVLLHRPRRNNGNGYLAFTPSYGSSCGWDGKGGRVIERWVMMFEGNKGRDTGRLKTASRSKTFYKKCLLMLRSLCLVVKLLPAYKLFRDLTASDKPSELSVGHHISSFTQPLTREEEARMQKYLFSPVETSCGSLSLSVLYLSSLEDLAIKPSFHILPHIVIPDYCGGISADPVCKAPTLHANRMVTYGSKPYGNDGKPSLTTEKGITAQQAQLPTNFTNDAAKRETSGAESWTEVSVKSQWPTAEAVSSTSPSCNRSHSLDAQSHPAKTLPHAARRSDSLDCLRSEVRQCLDPEELRDPFQPRLSDNAVIGSMFSMFHAAAPLHRTSAFETNNYLQATSVKTTSDALRELQDFVELKNKYLNSRSSITTRNTVSHSRATKSSTGHDSTLLSK